jgi:hypothetical protein
MIVPKETIEKMIDQADDRAEKAYRNYQETGTQRYKREQEKAEDLADALRMALSAYDDHAKLAAIKAELRSLGWYAHKSLRDGDPVGWEQNLRQIVAIAKLYAGLQIEEMTTE